MLTEGNVYMLMSTAYCIIYVLLPNICDLSSAMLSVATLSNVIKSYFVFILMKYDKILFF